MSGAPVQVQDLVLATADGTRLAAMRYAPGGEPVRGHLLLAGALAVPQRVYAPFARWMAGRGHEVTTFDPRGIGASVEPRHARSLRGLHADLLTWARQDFAAAVRAVSARAGGPVPLLGHSLGTHHAAMTDAETQARLAHVVAVAAGSGYWRDWAPASRRRAPLMLHLTGPLLTSLLGWFPGARLGMVGNLPGGVMRQWSRWCRHPSFAWGAEPEAVRPSLASARFAIEAFSFSDDEAMTLHCTQALLEAMPHARARVQVVAPADVGLARIGHLGAFRPASAGPLWDRLAAAVESPGA